jgi:hypothetical protein
MIESYDFGVLRIDGKEYHSDVIIYPESSPGGCRVDGSWWRKQGHRPRVAPTLVFVSATRNAS